MDHSSFDYVTPQQAIIAQYFDPKRYAAEEKQRPPNALPQMDGKAREALYRGEGSYPYQYSSHSQGARRAYTDDSRQRLAPGTQSHAAPNARSRAQDYSHMTAMQQRQEYFQRIAQHQHREYAERLAAEQAAGKFAASRMRAPEAAQPPPRNVHGYGHGEQYETSPRQSAFSYAAASHQQGSKVEKRPSIDSILGGFTQQQHPNANPAMMGRSIDPRQYHHSHQPHVEQYPVTTPPGRSPSHPKEVVANRVREQQALREWESHSQANQLCAKYTGTREAPPSKSSSHPNIPSRVQSAQDVPPADQFDAELAHLKNVVRQMEMMREQRDKYQSSAFQYLEKLGGQSGRLQHPPVQPSQNSPGSSKKNYPVPYHHSMPPPHQHVSSPPKYSEQPQKSPLGPPNRYLDPNNHQQQMALYQQLHSAHQRHYQSSQAHHAQNHAVHKKEISPIQILSQGGLPKIVDVRSLANGAAATVIDSSMSSFSRSKRRSSEPMLGEGRVMKIRMSSSPEGYPYEISDTRSADSCDSGVESLASPEAHMSSHLYNRNAIAHAQQQQLEAAKAQHAASFEAMKRQQQQLQQQQHQKQQQQQQQLANRQPNRNTTSDVRLERAGSPRKLSELIEKEKVCPSMFKEGIDSLTCKCQACLLHEEKTEIEIRDLYRERKIKKYTSTPVTQTVTKTQNSSHSVQNSAPQQNEVILIDDNTENTEKEAASMKHPVPSANESSTDTKRMKVSNAYDLNDTNKALDLSKKQSKPKSEQYEQLPLDLKVHPKDNREKERDTTSSKDQPQKPKQSGNVTVEQVIASCIRREDEKTGAFLHRGRTTSLEQIITECIDQEESFNRKDKEQVAPKEPPQPHQPKSATDLARADLKVLPSTKESTHPETNNNVICDEIEILDTSKTEKQLDLDKNLKQQEMQSHQQNNDHPKEDTQMQSKPKAKQSEVDKVLESQVVLKVMVEKLKVNSDMFLPASKDEPVTEQSMLQRACSFPTLKASAPEVVARTQRSQSVGLANTISAVPDPSISYPSQLKNRLLSVPAQQQEENSERPLSAPPAGTIEMAQGHKLASLYQPKTQDSTFIPKNLRDCWNGDLKQESKMDKESEPQPIVKDVIPQNLKDCWNESTSGDSKKSKESMGCPKMQWKAQWAKEKKSVLKPSEKSLCEICGVANPLPGDMNQDGSSAVTVCAHESQKHVASSLEHIASPQQHNASSDRNVAKVKVTDVNERKDDSNKTIHLGSLFQPNQFQNMFKAFTHASSDIKDKVVVDKGSTVTANTTPPETSQNFHAQTASSAVINGKQHGKATIFHKPKAAEPKVDQQNPNLAGSKPSDSMLKQVEQLDKQDSKQFPRLAPSPTAAVDNSSFSTQEQLLTSRSDTSQTVTISQPPVHTPVKNVLRVMPNVVQLPAASSTAQPPAVEDPTDVLVTKIQNSFVAPSEQSPGTEVAAVKSHLSPDGQTLSPGHPNTQTLILTPVVHSSNLQMASLSTNSNSQMASPSTNSSNVRSIQAEVPKDVHCEQNKDQIPAVDTSKTSTNTQIMSMKFNEKSSAEQSTIPTSVVQPMMQTVTTVSQAQTVPTQPKVEISRMQPVVSVSNSQTAMQITVDESPVDGGGTSKSPPLPLLTKEQTTVKASGEHPVVSKTPLVETSSVQPLVSTPPKPNTIPPLSDPPKLQPTTTTVRTSSNGQAIIQTSIGEVVVPASLLEQTVTQKPKLESQVQTLKSTDAQGVSNACILPSSSGQSSSKISAGEAPVVVTSEIQAPVLSVVEQPLSLVSRAENVVQQCHSVSTISGAETSQSLPKLQVALTPKVPIQVKTSIGPPPILISTSQVRPRTLLPAPVKLQVAQPVVQISTVHVVTPTSSVQVQSSVPTPPVVVHSPPKESGPQLQLITETAGKTDLQSGIAAEGNADRKLVPLPTSLENVNRRLKSNAPHIHVPIANGFSRYQKDSRNMREIYRVEMQNEPQPLDLKVAQKKKQTINASKVVYLQHSFPCVIRSEVPFVPPQMLQEAFFTAVDYGDFNYALQKCGIMHRYMTMQEQGAMSRACVTRTWNGSCKLVPLDEFDTKYEQITSLLERRSEEDQ